MYLRDSVPACAEVGLSVCDDPGAAIVAAATALEAQHKLWSVPASDGRDFFIRFRSSSSWSANRPDGNETIGTEAKSGLPREFCSRYSLRLTMSMNVNKLGPDIASACALEWCRRMQHFYSIWRMHGDTGYVFFS